MSIINSDNEMKYVILFFLVISITNATPEFSVWSGNKCSTCHFAEQGGGARNNFGWNFARDASFFKVQELSFLEPLSTNVLFDTLITYGMDFRMQTIRSHKTENAVRRFFPMQASAYLNIRPIENITIDAQYNFGPKIFQGQQMWSASAILKVNEDLPYVRIGYFPPAMGLKDCDMTDLDRRTAHLDGSESLFAPDYAELGAELEYSSLEWLTAQFGIFDASSLREVTALGDLKNAKSVVSRLVFYPGFMKNMFSDFFIGASNLTNLHSVDYTEYKDGVKDTLSKDIYFMYNTVFVGFAPVEDWLIQFKYTFSEKKESRKSYSYIGVLSYIPTPGIMINLKGQYGSSELYYNTTKKEYLLSTDITQLTLNAKVFLTPFLELIPEYRYMKTKEYKSTRWAFQIHLYY